MLMRVSLTTLCIVLCSNAVLAKDKSAASTPIACTGVFGPESSEALLIETYGADNVVTGMVPGPEGTEMLATTVYPGDDLNSMQFTWWEEQDRRLLSNVDLAPNQVGPLGLQIGQTIAQVEAINGEPFLVGGFDWDYGGYANIESGAIRSYDACFISIRFSPMADYPQGIDASAISGDVVVPSSEPLLVDVDAQVVVLSLGYAAPEGDE